MSKETLDRLMPILIGISGLVIVIGAYLRIMHNPIGLTVITAGFLANLFLSGFEIQRLKQIIKDLEHR